MSPEELREAYYLALVRWLGVLAADEVAAAWVARDAASRWWETTC